ncbi:hypothetical protein ABBQ32_001854 [Trebouxia sp. C0010 RCD-2024]
MQTAYLTAKALVGVLLERHHVRCQAMSTANYTIFCCIFDIFIAENQPGEAGTTLTRTFGLFALVKAAAQPCKDAMALPPRQACVYTAAEFTIPAVMCGLF